MCESLTVEELSRDGESDRPLVLGSHGEDEEELSLLLLKVSWVELRERASWVELRERPEYPDREPYESDMSVFRVR